MGKIDELMEKHKKEIEELQNNCKHEKLSDWKQFFWAINHSTGEYVKECLNCGKIIKRKYGIDKT